MQTFRHRPFVLLGVNEDADPTTARKAQDKNGLNWRSWWDKDRIIARDWKLRGIPSFYLIDHKGMIQYQGHLTPSGLRDMEAKIEPLLKQVESARRKIAKS